MMLVLLRVVIASLLVANRVLGLECSLCADGSPLPFPDTIIIPNKSCQDLADTFNETETVEQCYAIQVTGGVYCGCNKNNTSSTNDDDDEKGVCRLCGDDALLPFPSLFSKADAVTCAELEFDANLIQNDCTGYQNQFRDTCCSSVIEVPLVTTAAPVVVSTTIDIDDGDDDDDVACTLCEDGSAIPNPNFFPIYGMDCISLQEQYANHVDSDCVAVQATYGVYCGCNNPNATSTASDDGTAVVVCRICGGNTLLPNATQLGIRDPFDPVSCSEIEYEANTQTGGGDCQGYQAQFANRCGCESAIPPSSLEPSAVAVITSAPSTTDAAVTVITTNGGSNPPGSTQAPTASLVTSGTSMSTVPSRMCILLVAATAAALIM
jgi:hypothetical protein